MSDQLRISKAVTYDAIYGISCAAKYDG